MPTRAALMNTTGSYCFGFVFFFLVVEFINVLMHVDGGAALKKMDCESVSGIPVKRHFREWADGQKVSLAYICYRKI